MKAISQKPLISFIVPVYNAAKTLAECLDSLLNQSVNDHEILLVDDGSSDDSWEVMNYFYKKHPAIIRIYKKENSGPGETRNLGIRQALGTYLAFVDADDTIQANYVETIKYNIELHHPDMLMIQYHRIYIKNKTVIESAYKLSIKNNYPLPTNIYKTPELICKGEVAVWLRIIRRDLVMNSNVLLPGKIMIAEDLATSLMWYLLADNIVVLDDKLYNYKMAANTLNFSLKNIDHFKQVLDLVVGYYKKAGKYETFYYELEFLFSKHLLLSNIMRLRSQKGVGKFKVFLSLREKLLAYFPFYYKNLYMCKEPIFIKTAIQITYWFPKVFKLLF